MGARGESIARFRCRRRLQGQVRAFPLLAGALLSSCGGERLTDWDGDPPPSILFISVDTLRADALGMYGYKKPTSPELDAFAKTAAVFEQTMSSASWTLPSFASLFTSYFSSTHKCWKPVSKLDESFETLAEILVRNGYDTACYVSHPMLTSSNGMQQGFVHFDDSYSDPEADLAARISSQEISDRGIRFMQQKARVADGVPWFLWLHYFDPHSYYMPHEGITDDFIEQPGKQRLLLRGTYDGEIKYTDIHLGRIFKELEELGLAEETIVVFVSDHGEEFFEHGNVEHGSSLFNELVRVPLVIRVPGEEERRIPEVVRTVDVMPTLLDLVGIAVDFEIGGRSLRRLIQGEHLSLPPALMEIQQTKETIMKGIVRGRWKLVHNGSAGGILSLYDLEADPLEKSDVSDQNPAIVAELKRALEKMVEEAVAHGTNYDEASDQDMSPAELDVLQGLGYLLDD